MTGRRGPGTITGLLPACFGWDGKTPLPKPVDMSK